MKLYIVIYNGDYAYPEKVECITDDFDKWLKQHNQNRVADGNDPESAEEFDVRKVEVILFNKEVK